MRFRGINLLGKWNPAEIGTLESMLATMPSAWIEQNPHLKRIIRRDVLRNAPPEAPGHSKYDPLSAAIVVFDKGVYHNGKLNGEQFRRSIYHELGHTILRTKPGTINDWKRATNADPFIDEYAKTSPEEDFCDTFSEFFIHRNRTNRVVPKKADFMQRLFDRAQREKVAMHFINGFGDELVKTARPSLGLLTRMMSRGAKAAGRAGKTSIGKGVAIAGGAGLVGAEAGRRKGKKKGYAAGTKDVSGIAQKARMMGRREGVLAYHRALMQHRRRQATG